MQDDCEDYYNESLEKDMPGCCLNCPNAGPGCLCFDCMCTKCYWYDPLDQRCEMAHILSEKQRKNKLECKEGKVRNVVKISTDSILCQIGILSPLMWVPFSVIERDGSVKDWFLKKHEKDVYAVYNR